MGILTDFQSQNAIDLEIAKHEQAIFALSTRRNSFAAISQLPVDILSLIFLEVLPADNKNASACLEDLQSVCRHWKDLVVNTPWLWSRLYITPKTHDIMLAMTMLGRSKKAPLSVKLVSYTGAAKTAFELFWDFVGTVFAEFARIRSLDITAWHSLERFISAIPFDARAPLLRTLRINGEHSGEDAIRPSSFQQLASFPQLHTLALSYIRLPDKLPYLPQLRKLSVIPSTNPARASTTMTWLLNALKSTPNLHVLNIHRLSRSTRPAHGLTAATVKLDHLQFFDIVFTELSQSVLFDYLEFPPTTAIKAYFLDDHQNESSPKFISPLSGVVSRIIANEAMSSASCKTFIHLPSVLRLETTSDFVPLSLSLPPTIAENNMPAFIPVFSSLTPIARHATLSTTTSARAHSSIPRLVRSLQNLETVCFTDDYTTCQHFLRALIKAPDEATPPCPGLKSLEFRHTLFGIESIDGETIAILEDVVWERRHSATHIEKILVAEKEMDNWKLMFEFQDLLDVIGA